MRVVFHDRFKDDLREGANYYDQAEPDLRLGDAFIDEVEEVVRKIAAAPFLYRLRQ